jgi:type II secretory ATPase GspE/PulE/Tfp pilus assembly ATPase PilB-like protein
MVGEIRDSETAEIAINSALTGHLVFSTLHTNNAAGTIPRLIDLGVNPKVISSALNIAIAQRLARKLCDKCKVEVVPSPADQKFLSEILASVGKKRPELVLPPVTKFWQAKGCEACNNSGFKGRVGIFEAIKMDEKIAQVAIENPSEREIKIAAQSQGILDMRQDGVLKVLSGVTTLDELARVIDLSEEVL